MENIMQNNNISVSFLNVENPKELFKNVRDICNKNSLENVIIHFDIMDEKFVNNIGVDFNKLKDCKEYNFFADVHLMVEEPMNYFSKLVALGADSITVHYEIENLNEILLHLNRLKSQKKIKNIGLAIKPNTDIANIHEYMYLIDMILVMSVEPGMGGQTYIKEANNKITSLKAFNKIIQVDGGVNDSTIIDAKESGATSFVVGSYLTKNMITLEENLLKIYNMRG